MTDRKREKTSSSSVLTEKQTTEPTLSIEMQIARMAYWCGYTDAKESASEEEIADMWKQSSSLHRATTQASELRSPEPTPSAPPTMTDAAEMLWIVLANVSGGDWTQQSKDWQEAAARWRDNYFAALTACSLSPAPPVTEVYVLQDYDDGTVRSVHATQAAAEAEIAAVCAEYPSDRSDFTINVQRVRPAPPPERTKADT